MKPPRHPAAKIWTLGGSIDQYEPFYHGNWDDAVFEPRELTEVHICDMELRTTRSDVASYVRAACGGRCS